ncbi:MAG: hydroxyacid dehydrogenase [Bacteroidetes bacterium]|nr:hydroxyacid dehydrogenase [Bacteroidota bacterium]
MKILFIDSTDNLLVQLLSEQGHTLEHDYVSTKKEIEQKLHLFDGIVIRSRFKIDKQIIDSATNLKFIARVGSGMENIDVAYAEEKNIKCLHAPEGNCDAVAEHAIGMLLCLFNNLIAANNESKQGIWKREENRGLEIGGKTIGLIGYGNVGKAIAKKLSGFDVRIMVYDKYLKNFSTEFVTESNMQELYKECDIVSLHIPLSQETQYLANDSFFKAFTKNIYFINTSRGKIVNTADLVHNLKSGKIKGACLDVLEYETSSFEQVELTDLPSPFQYLMKSYNVVMSPHIAGWTHESNTKMSKILAEKISKI